MTTTIQQQKTINKIVTSSTILIRELELEMTIAFKSWEKNCKQKVIANLEIYLDMQKSSQSDNVEHSMDYDALCEELKKWAKLRSFNLLEKLSHDLTDKIYQFHPDIKKIKLDIHKIGVVENTKSCGVALETIFIDT